MGSMRARKPNWVKIGLSVRFIVGYGYSEGERGWTHVRQLYGSLASVAVNTTGAMNPPTSAVLVEILDTVARTTHYSRSHKPRSLLHGY
jgi:hypothetical protein